MNIKGGYKKLAFILIMVLVVSLVPIISSAGDGQASRVNSEGGVGFHCGTDQGGQKVNKEVKVTGSSEYEDGASYAIQGQTGKDLWLERTDENVNSNVLWVIEGGQGTYTCPCGSTEWVSYSNNSGEFNGKNVQMVHRAKTTEYGSVTLTKTDEDSGLELSGATFTLTSKDSSNKVYNSTDNGDGTYSWTNIPVGDYTINEVTAPEGYDKDSFDINGDTVKVTKNSTIELDGTNKTTQTVKGSVKLNKYDNNENSLTGASFYLEKDETKYPATDNNDGTYTWDNLELGTYYLHEESAAPGYDKDSFTIGGEKIGTDGYEVVVENSTQIVIDGYNSPTEEILGSGWLIKTDADDPETTIAGVSFYLEKDGAKYYANDNKDGTYTWEDLVPGNYVLHEESAAAGYDKNSLTIGGEPVGEAGYDVEISEDGIWFELTATNKKTDEEFGALLLNKLDSADSSPISGAEFLLINTETLVSYSQTADNGVAAWNGLPYGEYKLYETKVSDGYKDGTFRIDNTLVGADGYTVVIGEDTPEVTITATNEKSSVLGEFRSPIDEGNVTQGEDDGSVLGEDANPNDGSVLGEEAKTDDSMNMMLIIFFILAGLAVAGGLVAQRKIK